MLALARQLNQNANLISEKQLRAAGYVADALRARAYAQRQLGAHHRPHHSLPAATRNRRARGDRAGAGAARRGAGDAHRLHTASSLAGRD